MANARSSPLSSFDKATDPNGTRAARREKERCQKELDILNDEVRLNVSKETKALEARSKKGVASPDEISRMLHLQRSERILEMRENDMTGDFAQAHKQILGSVILKGTVLDLALERDRQENQVVGTVSTALGNVITQYEIIKLACTLKIGNRMQKDALDGQTKGLNMILEERKRINDSIVAAHEAIATSAAETEKALETYL